MDNIVLIGMPGAGKSTVGVLLAKRLGYRFVDTDLLIQEIEGKRLFEIMRDNGNEYFADAENRIVASLKVERSVIATGGSVVFGSDAMQNLKSLGKVVYLRVPLAELEKRVNNFETRGILMKSGQTLKDIYAERTPLYERYADLTIDCDGDLADNAIKIEQLL
ncbi:MAG: shikimate kinase [Oscillospiraceae bacterium]|nr:shikimate kinase [Oscillospiraceae bacterium]